MFERLKTYDSRLRAAIARKEQQYIFEHDDFYKVSRSEVPSIILLSKPKRVFIYLLSIFTCSIGLFVAIAANEGHNREPRQKYNTVSNGTAPIPRTMTKTEFEEKYGINPSPPGSTAPPQINFPQTDVSSAKTSVEKLTKEIQQYLTILGYKPGPIDGLLGDKTTNAIKSYQKDTGLIEDGKITWNLRDLLKAASQSPSTSVVSSVKQPDKGPWEKYSSGNTVNGQILPQSGDVRLFTNDECIAPFEIRAGQGSHYLVKLVRAYNDTSVLTVFVRSGTTVNIDVPLGNYEVRYAAGNTWYGYDSLFGPETSYNKANETFNFEIEGNQVSGFTITLYTVANGNLSMKKINPQDF